MATLSREMVIQQFMFKAKKDREIRNGSDEGFQSALILSCCWISFEAFTCLTYQINGVWERIKKFCNDFSDRYSEWFDKSPDDFRRDVTNLKKYPISDMRPGHGHVDPISISDEKKLENVLEVVYRIRCNLIHGGKNVKDDIDAEIIRLSSGVIYYILDHFLREEGFNW